MRVLARLEKTHLDLVIIDSPTSTVLVDPSIALVNPTMIYVAASSVLANPFMTSMVLP